MSGDDTPEVSPNVSVCGGARLADVELREATVVATVAGTPRNC
jgi:hypothetical protein